MSVYIEEAASPDQGCLGDSHWGQISFGTFVRHPSNTRTDSRDKRDKRLEGRAGGGIDTTEDRDRFLYLSQVFFFIFVQSFFFIFLLRDDD